MEFFHRLLYKLVWLVAGLIGAVVASWRHKDDLKELWSWAIFLITGIACAFYLTGIVCDRLVVTEPSNVAGVGFLLGAFGGSLMAAINRVIMAADLWALIRQRLEGNPP